MSESILILGGATATGLAIVTLVVVTLLTHKNVAAMPLTDIDGKPVDYRDRLGNLDFAESSQERHELP